VLKGALAAAVTPFRDGGAELDEAAFGPLADFLVAGGLDAEDLFSEAQLGLVMAIRRVDCARGLSALGLPAVPLSFAYVYGADEDTPLEDLVEDPEGAGWEEPSSPKITSTTPNPPSPSA